MKFKLIDKKDRITSFELRDDGLLFLTLDKKLYLNKELIFDNDVSCFVKKINKTIVFGTFNPNVYIYKNSIVSLLAENYSLAEKKYNDSKIIISKRISKGVYDTNIYDYIKNSIDRKIENEPVINIENYEIYRNHNTLSSLSLLTGEREWELDLGGRNYIFGGVETENRIVHVFGVIDNYLYLWMEDNRLLEIDITTGKINSEAHPLEAIQACNFDSATAFIKYRESEKSAFIFNKDFLVQLHLPTQKVTLIWQDDNYNIGPSFITDKYIYFIGNNEKGTFFRDHIGVFDREKNEVVWMQQVIELSKKTYNNLKEIQANEDKIYVLDTEGTLYIYEREVLS